MVDSGCVQSFTNFNGVKQYGKTLLGSHLEQNMKAFMDWAFLSIGAFTNINVPTSGGFGADLADLRLVNDPSYSSGQVWETFRKDWVYETGVEFTGGQPFQVTGVFVNGVHYGTGDSVFGHHYNYYLGRIIFDSAVARKNNVELKFSYRNVQVYRADDAPWWDEIQYNSLRPDDTHFQQIGEGDWAILANHRVQLPAIVLEIVPRRSFEPHELGNLSQWVKQDMLFHVLAETRWDRNQLIDVISFQNDKTIWLFDSNKIAEDEVYPLDFRGMLIPGSGSQYPTLVTPPYRWKKMRFENTQVTEVNTFNPTLHEGTVRSTLRVLWGDRC